MEMKEHQGFSDTALSLEDDKERDFIELFEYAIDCLRVGSSAKYNERARHLGIATIKKHARNLPTLTSFYTQEYLIPYKKLAEKQ